MMFWLFAALFIGLNINLIHKTEPGQELGLEIQFGPLQDIKLPRNPQSALLLQRLAFLTIKTFNLGFVLNMKVVDIFLSFPTLIFTPRSDNLSQSYGLHSEQGSKHIKNRN